MRPGKWGVAEGQALNSCAAGTCGTLRVSSHGEAQLMALPLGLRWHCRRWDGWARMTQPLLSRVPLMATGGNHVRRHLPGGGGGGGAAAQ